jgi:hypothetical protein
LQPTDVELSFLQNLEFVIVEIGREHPEMTDHAILRAYEAAYQLYRHEIRGHTPTLPQLTGLDLALFNSVRDMCEFRLGRAPSEPLPEGAVPVSLETIVACLRQLMKSVERHTRVDGRFGYIGFIRKFVG